MSELTENNLDSVQFLSQPEEREIDLLFLWKIIQTRRWFVFTVAAIALTISSLYVLRLPNVYTGSTKILIERVDQSAYQNPEMMKPLPDYAGTYFYTRAEILKSHRILKEAAEDLNLVEHYKKKYKHIKTNEQAVNLLIRRANVKIVRGTQIIELAIKDENPEWAAKIADMVTEDFIKESWRERLFISDQLLKWFPSEGEALSQNSPINQLKKMGREDAVGSLPSVLQDPTVGNIKQERVKVDAEIKELSKRYTPEHPKMKELLARADYLESEMKAQVEKIVAGLKSGLTGEFSISNTKVIENAQIPTSPSGPPRLTIVFLSTVLATLLSVALIALLYYLDQNIRTEENIRKIPMSFLGYLPLITTLNRNSANGKSKNLPSHIISDLRIIDEITNIRAAVLFSMPAERSKLLMCTSAIPEEGKTTVASLLGISLAEIGERVLLIDADMRKPSLHRVFGLENKIGLSNCLIGSVRAKDVIHKIKEVPGLDIMTAGENTPNPAILLSSASIDRLIGEFESEYGKIIFDVPPALHIADGLILAGKVHGTILVFNSGKIHHSLGKKMKERIANANGVVIGGVINRADYRRLDYAYYRYYRQYKKYYDHTSDNSELHETTSLVP